HFTFRGEEVPGEVLAETIREELTGALTGEAAPYNLVFTTNGISSTTASVVTAALGIRDLGAMTEEDVDRVRRAHLLLAMFNALQPGVFALSGWDLVGALPIPAEQVEALLVEGDTRWIHRPAYDLLDLDPDATRSISGMPPGRALYGPIDTQLETPGSFVDRLREILHLRGYFAIPTTRQVDVPDVAHPAMLVMVHEYELAPGQLEVTVLNFGEEPVSGTVISTWLE